MKRKQLTALLTAACILAGSALPAFASLGGNPDVYPFPGGKTFADESWDSEEFTLQFEGGTATHINLKDYLLNENVDPESVVITPNLMTNPEEDWTGASWLEGITDEYCGPATAKEWKLTYTGAFEQEVYDPETGGFVGSGSNTETVTLVDYETPKEVEKYELNFHDDNEDLRRLTSKINAMLREEVSYGIPNEEDGGFTPVFGAKYTVDYRIIDNVARVVVFENGKYFWRQAPNFSFTGLEIYEKDPVLMATIDLKNGDQGLPGDQPLDPDAPASKYSIENFVQSIYRLALNRTPDTDGFNFWTQGLRSLDFSGKYILLNLLNEPEYRNMSITADEFVTDMYLIVCGRESVNDIDEDGYNYWTGRYNDKVEEIVGTLIDVPEGEKYAKAEGEARYQILKEMVDSQEFGDRCHGMGIYWDQSECELDD